MTLADGGRRVVTSSVLRVTRVLIATDADEIFDELDAALGDGSTAIDRVRTGMEVRDAAAETEPDLVILDLQIGRMGGVAASLDLRNEQSGGRMPSLRILLLLDREADEFLAGRSGADGWIVKPFDALQVRRATADLLAAPPTLHA
jgi:DNA-binding response OmpR family regulator